MDNFINCLLFQVASRNTSARCYISSFKIMLLALLYKIITKLWCYLKCHLIYSHFIYFLNDKEIIFFFFNNKEKSFRLGQNPWSIDHNRKILINFIRGKFLIWITVKLLNGFFLITINFILSYMIQLKWSFENVLVYRKIYFMINSLHLKWEGSTKFLS